MDKLFLHIGLTKTGSSAIQSWFSANSEALAEIGVSYADLAPDAKLNRISAGNAQHIVRFLRIKDRGPELTDRRLEREIRRTYFDGKPTAIISGEAMTNATAPRIRRLKRALESPEMEVVVIAYIRNIYDHFWSGYQQMIKRAGYHRPPAEFAATYPNIQVNALRRWTNAFDQVRVVNYDSAKGSLIESFAGTCELELPAAMDTSVARINRSLSAAERELLLEVNRQADERGLEFRALLSDALIYASPEAESAFVTDDEVLEVLRGKYADDVAWVNRDLLAEDPIAIEPAAVLEGNSHPDLGEAQVTPEVSALIGALLDQVAEPARYVRRKLEGPAEAPAKRREKRPRQGAGRRKGRVA